LNSNKNNLSTLNQQLNEKIGKIKYHNKPYTDKHTNIIISKYCRLINLYKENIIISYSKILLITIKILNNKWFVDVKIE
jgi:hypothetical protein